MSISNNNNKMQLYTHNFIYLTPGLCSNALAFANASANAAFALAHASANAAFALALAFDSPVMAAFALAFAVVLAFDSNAFD